jgi:transcriptional regulator with XRE-family HTH domain
MTQELRRLLTEAREASGMNQTELGKAMGRSQSFVSNYERGQRRLDVPEFIQMCRVLGLDPHVMLERVEAA